MSENERELVLGNKQLLGIFFVATLLCGVFFAMGYVVGGNSAKPQATSTADNGETSAEGKREEPQAAPASAQTGVPDSGAAGPTEPLMADNPAAAGSQPPASASVPAPAAQPAPAPVSAASAPPPPAPVSAANVGVSTQEPGATYLQVSAIERPAADAMVRAIRERQMPAILTESPKANLYRVLVGPYHSTLALADAKNKLKVLGFGDVLVIK